LIGLIHWNLGFKRIQLG